MKRAIGVVLQVTLLVGLTTAAIGTVPAHAVGLDNSCSAGSTSFPANDDGSVGPVSLGFTANFFGTDYTNVYVNNNGNVTFNSPLGAFTPSPIGTGLGFPIIAPFWADVDTRGAGSAVVTYGTTTLANGDLAFCVTWDGVGYYGGHTDKLNRFQLVLEDRSSDQGPGSFDIVFRYNQIQWETGDASGGHSGLGGASARAGYSDGQSGGTSYELPGSGVNGALLDSNSATGLINNDNSGVPGYYVYPVRNGNPGPALTLTKTDSPDPVQELNPITYTLTAGNTGVDDANNVVVTDNLPAGTVFDSASSTSETPCSHTATTVTCPIGTLSGGSSATVTIIVQAPDVTADTTITNHASVSADNAATVNASADTTVTANTGGSTQGSVPPNAPVPLTFTTSTDSTSNGTPAVDGTDPTAVSLRVPPGGPGGSVSLEELPCTQAPCTGSGSLAPATSVVLGNVVFNVVPPTGYPANKPFRATLLYDASLNPTSGPIYYFKDGVTPTEIQLPKCGATLPRGQAPCVVSSRMLVTTDPVTNGDWKVIVKINSDPRLHHG